MKGNHYSEGLFLLFSTLLLALFLHHFIDSTLQTSLNASNSRSLLLLIVGLLYAVSMALALIGNYDARKSFALDASLKPFDWEPVPLHYYGERFNAALDAKHITSENLSVAERIVINQRMKYASILYIDWKSLRPDRGNR
jgi:hypothetical protein